MSFFCTQSEIVRSLLYCSTLSRQLREVYAFWFSLNRICLASKITQPDGTLFFLIFTYLRGRSHWNSRDYASNVGICHFLKPETNKGDFRLYFELDEKSCRGRHHSEISKTNTKTLIYSIWIRPRGPFGFFDICFQFWWFFKVCAFLGQF
jgi:hypothetical protein